jgi:hypothetical protein
MMMLGVDYLIQNATQYAVCPLAGIAVAVFKQNCPFKVRD